MSISDNRKIPFYWGMTRKYIICFSEILTGLYIQKFNESNEVIKNIRVPYTYNAKEKMYYKKEKKDAKYNLTLPRMSYRFNSMIYDGIRANPKGSTLTYSNNGTIEEFIHNGKPYNFDIDVKILSKTQADLFQIIENLIAKFDNDYKLRIEELENTLYREVQVVIGVVTFPDEFDLDESGDRILEASISFILKGFIYPPIAEDYIIKNIKLEYSTNEDVVVDKDLISDIDA